MQSAKSVTDTGKLNIIIIFTDDMGYADINPFSASDLQTPNLDKMVAESARFTHFYIAQPVCSASRAALLTGSYSNNVAANYPEVIVTIEALASENAH